MIDSRSLFYDDTPLINCLFDIANGATVHTFWPPSNTRRSEFHNHRLFVKTVFIISFFRCFITITDACSRGDRISLKVVQIEILESFKKIFARFMVFMYSCSELLNLPGLGGECGDETFFNSVRVI